MSDKKLTPEEEEKQSSKLARILVRTSVVVIALIVLLINHCGNYRVKGEIKKAESAEFSPQTMVMIDVEVAPDQRKQHYPAMMYDFGGDSIEFVVGLTTLRSNAAKDWLLGEKENICRYELRKVSEDTYQGYWYQFERGNTSGYPNFQGIATLERRSDGTYTGKCLWSDERFIKTFVIQPRISPRVTINP